MARIPVSNLRVPRAEFVALWAAAERLDEEQRAWVQGAQAGEFDDLT